MVPSSIGFNRISKTVSYDPATCRGPKSRCGCGVERPSLRTPYHLALGYAAIHDNAAALSYLEKSIREPQVLYLEVEPLFDELRREARYIALERRLGLPG